MTRILVVEDDAAIASGLLYALGQEGFEALSCAAAKETVRRLETEAFDLILLDVSLPDGNGYDLCKLIKAKKDIPIIFLTACDDEVNIVMGLDMGADDYITKPFRIRELISRIRTVLRRFGKQEEKREVIAFGNICIYPAKAQVYKDNHEVLLTALEYRLLLTLAGHRGQVLTRSQLLEGIWDISGDFVNDNTLTVYMKRLREKLESDPQNPRLIKTVRGLGYKLE